MINILLARLQQKHRTIEFPDGPAPALPPRFRGRPEVHMDGQDAQDGCPFGAIRGGRLDMGKCLFCADCPGCAGNTGETPMLQQTMGEPPMPQQTAGEAPVPHCALTFTSDYRMAARRREDLLVGQGEPKLAEPLDEPLRRLFGRSLKLRQVSAGGCNACEADTNVLGTVGWDLGRFGISFVASPRHADGLLITGPVTQNMKLALQKTYEATPAPKIVIAVGAAISGGPYIGHDEVCGGADKVLPVDLYIPGCPPHPLTILDGLLRLLGRIK